MIDDVEARAIELRGEQAFGESHPHGIGEALPERAGGRFNARGEPVFRVAGGLRVQLAKATQLVDRQIVAREMQERVQQHRAVAVREHEAVAVRPFRVGRVVAQMFSPQRQRDFGHSHRHAGMTRVRRLHGIHGQRANRVGQVFAHVWEGSEELG